MLKKEAVEYIYAILLCISLIFLQSGYSYYASMQTFAIFFLLLLTLISKPKVEINLSFCLILLAFIYLVILRGYFFPNVINSSTKNITLKIIGLIGYATIITVLFNLKLRKKNLLNIIEKSAKLTIAILFILIAYINLSPYKFFLLFILEFQNKNLVVNFTTIEPLAFQMINELRQGIMPRMDLFYGEPSYLSVVIFTIAITLLAIKYLKTNSDRLTITTEIFTLISIFSLVMVGSLSGVIYALIITLYIFTKIHFLKSLIYTLFVFSIIFFSNTYSIIYHRLIDINNSISLMQRFGEFEKFTFTDYLIGLTSYERIPIAGFNNGISYLIAISGIAGILLFISGFYKIMNKIPDLKIFLLIIIGLTAIIMQNGGIFSPNKIFLMSLIVLPITVTK